MSTTDNARHDAPVPPPRRRRRWHRHIGFGGIALIAIASILIAWLLLTVSGRNTLLGRVVSMLPPGSLTWERADGVVYGPVTLYGVHYRHDGVDVRAQRVMLDPSLRQSIFGRKLHLDALEMDAVTLDLPVDRSRQPLPSWPDSLPKLATPLTLDADRVRVRDLRISREGVPLVRVSVIHGGIDVAPGMLALQKLEVDSDRGRLQIDARIDVGRHYQTNIDAMLQVPARQADNTSADLRVHAKGDLDHFLLVVDGHAPGPVSLRLALDKGRATPVWSFSLQAPRFDPNSLIAPYPYVSQGTPIAVANAIALQVDGVGGRAQLHGRIAQGARVITIAPSQLVYEQGMVEAQPLLLKVLEGEIRLQGHADLRPASPVFNISMQLDDLRWSATRDATPVKASGTLGLVGTFDAWTVSGALELLRDKRSAYVTLAGRGDRQQVNFEKLDARMPAGLLTTKGQLRWSPQIAWTADATMAGFDPGYVAPGFEGAVSGRVQTAGGIDAAGALSLHAAVDQLSGQLRGRRLAGHGTADWKAGVGHTDLDLHVGASHVQASGQFGRALDLLARFDPLRLDDLLPNAQGALAGQIALRGDPSAPAIEGHLQGNALHWNSYGAAGLLLDGKLPARGADGLLRADADGITGIPGLSALHLHIVGSEQSPRVDGELTGEIGTLALSGNAEHQGSSWNGLITSLHYAPSRGGAWALSAPAKFRYDGSNAVRLEPICLSSGDASLCADADWPHRANLQAHAMPLNLLDPWLARPDFDAHAYGIVDFDAHVAPAAHGSWVGTAQLHSTEGGVHLQSQLSHPLFQYTNLIGHASLEREHLQLRIDSGLAAGGTMHAQLETGLASDAALSGNVTVDLRDLAWVELLSTDLAAPKGRLSGHLALGGSRAHPTASGRAVLAGFAAELPSLGIALHEGQITLDADPGGAARISGSLRSGDGTLAIGGALHWNDPSAPLTVTLRGQNVRIADTPELSAIASPDLQLGYASGTLSVRGKVDVSKARMNLEKLDSTVSPSPDVVVLDPVEASHGSALVVDVDLMLALGDDVELRGFGLDGKLGGQLRVRSRSGKPMTASGGLDVSGTYAVYGRKLDIVRGRLGYNGGGFDNPSLDILAQHEFDQATIGVRVRGTALRPQTQIVSTPAMEPSDALSYLVLGRPLRSASADEGRQVGAAAAALSAGGNLIAQKIGVRLGLDEAGVSESRSLGGTVFTVGKYISPRLFLSYGVSLVGTGEVLTLKYLLRKGFDIQVESGRENRASINWRIEK